MSDQISGSECPNLAGVSSAVGKSEVNGVFTLLSFSAFGAVSIALIRVTLNSPDSTRGVAMSVRRRSKFPDSEICGKMIFSLAAELTQR